MKVCTVLPSWEIITATARPVPSSQQHFPLFSRIDPSRLPFVSSLLTRQSSCAPSRLDYY